MTVAATASIGLNTDHNDTDLRDQYLTFMVADEEYGVDILRVVEIKGWQEATHIPNTPDYVEGVINIRGTIVPIINLRSRFGLSHKDHGPTTVVIVLRVEGGNHVRTMGLVVDGVSDVCNVPSDEMKPPPDFGSSVSIEYVKGLSTVNDAMVIALDVDKLLNSDEIAIITDVMD